ncbi:1,4-dihydroxy-6-naphthoate synthase [Aridibaculum aurantiacum]|uniref:1,4-dihydroxy-6-naphthoate synthase n=1 Tax=Aridibaculum aurantiacum TaxID=2810307 RepID=UPI001A97B179|nr:1,4-dihydroxy-6-naphthoate synthase [Aridibaculum aurantiacum]
MKLTLGFSPCPNDTFIFDALVNGKIDTQGYEFEVVLEDVQTLNQWALQEKLDISKISYGVLPLLLQKYQVLNSGGALGKGVGPLLVSTNEIQDIQKPVSDFTIAIPGENTTAHLLFSYAFPSAKKKVFKVFHEIENAVIKGEVDAGVIIHENRFTYQQKGLKKLLDLGEYWEQQTNIPIPLGGIVGKRILPKEVLLQVDRLIQQSLQYAFDHVGELPPYVQEHAQEMDQQVMQQHIDLYVNNYSLRLGDEGKAAVGKLLEVYKTIHPAANIAQEDIFIS